MERFIGTAGWSIPRDHIKFFPEEGSHLERYSQVFNMVEINSSFYREHKPETYLRWYEEVPKDFRFSVKLSKTFTHECGLNPMASQLKPSLEGLMHLQDKLGVVLIQIAGSVEFNPRKMARFFELIRKTYWGPLAIEPRNVTWMRDESQKLMIDYGVSKVIADPERCPTFTRKLTEAGGLSYYRLHGSPDIYRSSYSKAYLTELSKNLKGNKNVWCVFDNTSRGAATGNALSLNWLF